ncbi:MAG: PAS domain S-box protein, partial [Deltaproteobacteria bacterium]|nr:PAS domain S-box protein [Deltaproteobacteria bacterium]
MNTEYDILIVDDEIPNLRLLTKLLEKEGYNVRPAEKAQTAIDSALAKPPGLILLDVRMPEIDGFELCRQLKQDERTNNVPIIFISALQDVEAKIQGFEAGGVDFIFKPFEELEILARVRTHLSLHRTQQHLEQLVEERVAGVAESEARFSTVVENANESIVITQDGVVKYSNSKVSELTGYLPEEIHLHSFDTFIHPEDLETVRREYRARMSGERPTSSYSARIITKDGREKHVLINSAMIDWDDKPATLAMVTDITERVLVSEELQKSEERFRKLMEQSPLAITILTPEGQISQVNAAWMRLWSLNEEETAQVLKKYNMLTDKQIKALGFGPLVESAFAGQHVVLPPMDYSGNRATEEMGLEGLKARSAWIQSHLYSVKDANGEIEYVVNTNMDITDRKLAEIALRGAYTEIKKLKTRLEAESAYLQDEI